LWVTLCLCGQGELGLLLSSLGTRVLLRWTGGRTCSLKGLLSRGCSIQTICKARGRHFARDTDYVLLEMSVSRNCSLENNFLVCRWGWGLSCLLSSLDDPAQFGMVMKT
jgi:hypothetical protein